MKFESETDLPEAPAVQEECEANKCSSKELLKLLKTLSGRCRVRLPCSRNNSKAGLKTNGKKLA